MNANTIFKAILDVRGISQTDTFFNPQYSDLHDPLSIPDSKKAIARLETAFKKKEKVGIYGDYDIDGLCATTLLMDAFSKFGIEAIGYIPDRFRDGYGMSNNGIDELDKEGVALIVTVDCGSRSEEEIKYAQSKGIDTIVTDHHEIDQVPPSAVATINAKRKDSKYAFSERSGAGIAFALVQAMQKSGFVGLEDGQEKWLLDLVAMSTVADIVPLIDENRVLLKWGLEVLKKTKRPGILALMEVSSFRPGEIDETKIGFRLGPRINAAGRMKHGKLALDLLTAPTLKEARQFAAELDELNTLRRGEQESIASSALEQARTKYKNDAVLVLSDSEWAQGVVGIVASKLVEVSKKPSFIMQELDGGLVKGSARSFGDFDLSLALSKVRSLLVSGGGHKYAAGVTVKKTDLEKFRKKLNEYYKSLGLKNQEDSLRPIPEVKLGDFTGLDLELVDLIEQLAPFGEANHRPMLAVSEVRVEEFKPVGSSGVHAKLLLKDSTGASMQAIGFGMSEVVSELDLNSTFSVIGHISRNDFNGRSTIQLELRDIKA